LGHRETLWRTTIGLAESQNQKGRKTTNNTLAGEAQCKTFEKKSSTVDDRHKHCKILFYCSNKRERKSDCDRDIEDAKFTTEGAGESQLFSRN